MTYVTEQFVYFITFGYAIGKVKCNIGLLYICRILLKFDSDLNREFFSSFDSIEKPYFLDLEVNISNASFCSLAIELNLLL